MRVEARFRRGNHEDTGAPRRRSGVFSLHGEPAPTQGDAPAMKIISDGRFAFGRQSADGAIAYAGGGTCRQEDGKYIETVAYHWLPTLVGMTITFDCALKDGLWYHKARFEAGGERFDIDEVWRRVAETSPRD